MVCSIRKIGDVIKEIRGMGVDSVESLSRNGQYKTEIQIALVINHIAIGQYPISIP